MPDYSFLKRAGLQRKITKAEEKDLLKHPTTGLVPVINALVARCNNKPLAGKPTGYTNISLLVEADIIDPVTKGSALTAAEYDSNINRIEGKLQQILDASQKQGYNPLNRLRLFRRNTGGNYPTTYTYVSGTVTASRRNVGAPLTSYHRDSNYYTIQVVINTLNNLYDYCTSINSWVL